MKRIVFLLMVLPFLAVLIGCDTLPTAPLPIDIDPIANFRQLDATETSITVAWDPFEGALYEISVSAPNDSTRWGLAGTRDSRGVVVHMAFDADQMPMQPGTRYWVQVVSYGDGVPEVKKILCAKTE